MIRSSGLAKTSKMSAPMKSMRKTLSAKSEISSKELIKQIKSKLNNFSEDKKNANNLIDVISIFQEDGEDVLLACMRGMHKVFTHAITMQHMYMNIQTQQHNEPDLCNADKYKVWLRERYGDVKERLLDLISHDNTNIQELALCTLVNLVKSEGNTPLKEITGNHLFFPVHLFEPIVLSLLTANHNQTSLICRFQEYLDYDDIRYYTMKISLTDIKERSELGQDLPEVYMLNMYSLLERLSMPCAPTEEAQVLTKFISKYPENTDKLKITSYKEHKKLFTTLWLEYLKKKLPMSIYKKVLLILHEKVLPHMTSPLLLSDFLTESYNIGGAISLLALNGLFILVNKHNLNYPDFYVKLYTLFTPGVLHVKYMARFFYLADLFLTSTHLPAYLVAAFAKKLARIALTAPANCVLIILPFIHNLLQRHPSCQVLIHRPAVTADVTSDLYDIDELDLSKCGALDSSLWEIKSLQNHYHHAVATEAKKFDRPLNDREIDVGPLLENTITDMIDKDMKKKTKEVALTFTTTESLFIDAAAGEACLLSQFWTLSS